MSELYSRLFILTTLSHSELLDLVAKVSGGVVDGWTVVTNNYEIDVRPNDDSSPDALRENPGDFLCFPYTVEIVSEADECHTGEYVDFVGSMMTSLHEAKMKVVAACDWEKELPGKGRLGV